ncbi:MAG: hypothetical protein ACUVX9_13740 [Anaerolineae bacterium]
MRHMGFVACLLALLIAACSAPGPVPAPSPNPLLPTATANPTAAPVKAPLAGRYVFIEALVTVDGTGALPAVMIDFPTYTFDKSTGTLSPFSAETSIPLAETDWGLLGTGSMRVGSAGGGAATQLVPIPALPYTTTIGVFTGKAKPDGQEEMRQAPLVFEAMTPEGTLVVHIDGRRVMLAPGAAWTQIAETDVQTPQGAGHYRVITRIVNHGWLQRSKLGS